MMGELKIVDMLFSAALIVEHLADLVSAAMDAKRLKSLVAPVIFNSIASL